MLSRLPSSIQYGGFTEADDLFADAALPAHLVTSADDRPHVAPVWYGYEDGHVHVFTNVRKPANVRKPRVAVAVAVSVSVDSWTNDPSHHRKPTSANLFSLTPASRSECR